MATGSCASTHYLGVNVFGLGFEACTTNCVAAAATDLLLALQAAVGAVRIAGHGPCGEVGRAALMWTVVNAVWSGTGAPMWLQPGPERLHWFEALFRGNALAQAGLVATSWLMASAMLLSSGDISRDTHRRLGWVALVHGAVFALLSALPGSCAFEQYVLFGGSNLTPPLMSLFLVVVHLVRRHALPWPHPLCLMCAVALPFWVGNAGVLCGKHAGPTLWLRGALRAGLGDAWAAWLNWEEMSTFHAFGAAGNELLWRAFAWLAAQEAHAAASHGGATLPPGWLSAALAAKSKTG